MFANQIKGEKNSMSLIKKYSVFLNNKAKGLIVNESFGFKGLIVFFIVQITTTIRMILFVKK